MCRRVVICVLALLAVAAGACGDDTADVGSTTTTAGTARADATDIDLVECHQFGVNTGVDPGAAQAYCSTGRSCTSTTTTRPGSR